jgi:hypothetical protein
MLHLKEDPGSLAAARASGMFRCGGECPEDNPSLRQFQPAEGTQRSLFACVKDDGRAEPALICLAGLMREARNATPAP